LDLFKSVGDLTLFKVQQKLGTVTEYITIYVPSFIFDWLCRFLYTQ
jgi:hypothetical protein